MVMRSCDEVLANVYDGLCTVYASEPVAGKLGWADERSLAELYCDIPCHLAFEKTAAAGDGLMSEVDAVCVLFCGADYDIRPGSMVLVKQRGREYRLALTGLPRVYVLHQEIKAALLDELA